MKQYLLSVYHQDDTTAGLSPEEMESIYRDVDVVNAEMQKAGAWVFAGGLHPASTASVVREQNGEVLITDGPFVEGKEHIGGFWIIQAPDLDAALDWSRKATRACRQPIEVRPLHDQPES